MYYKNVDSSLVFAFAQGMFTFSYKEEFEDDGWLVYKAEDEYKRQGFDPLKTNGWRLTKANSKFELCSSYPTLVRWEFSIITF